MGRKYTKLLCPPEVLVRCYIDIANQMVRLQLADESLRASKLESALIFIRHGGWINQLWFYRNNDLVSSREHMQT